MDIKTDVVGLYKDTKSGGLINKDNSALSAYKKQKEIFRQVKTLENKIEELENKINVIIKKFNQKEMLNDYNCS